MLHITNLTYRIADRLLFNGATAAIPPGAKVGLVGRNGTGKTTLLGMILGEIVPESGDVRARPRASVIAVAQEAPGGDRSLIDTVLDAHVELRDLEARAETETDPHEIADIHVRLSDIGAHSAPAKASSILAGLGFDEAAQNRPCSSYSGGWRMRVALAAALFMEPDLLLLDEPTNYLDLEGVLWLEQFLASYPYTILIVSHDRDLMNGAVNRIMHLEDGRLTLYTGGYDRFERTRAEQLERQASMRSRQEAQRRHIQSFVDRFRAQANKARQAQSRIKMLERMKPIASVVEAHTIPFTFPHPAPLSSPLIALEETTVGYDVNNPVLKKLDLRIDADDRIAILGANGNGKSTFAKLLAGRLKPFEGKKRQSRHLRVGYFAQHQLDEMDAESTPLEVTSRMMPDTTETKVRARLGKFGFGYDKVDRKIDSLSGGEKARLLFALMSHAAPQLMILDEPTNHLDVDSREALIQAINGYNGAVVVISHDRHLINACADRLWVVGDGKVERFDGDLADYRAEVLKSRRGRKQTDKATNKTGGEEKRQSRRGSARKRSQIRPFKNRVRETEKALEQVTERKRVVDLALSNPKLYEQGNATAADKREELLAETADLSEAIQTAEDAWIEASHAFEEAETEFA